MRRSLATLLAAGLISTVPALAQTAETPAPAAAAAPAATTQPAAPAQPSPAELNANACYAIGHNFGSRFKADSIDLNLAQFMQGVQDGYAGKESRITPEQAQAAIVELQRQLMARQAEQQTKAATKNKTEGDAFLAKHKAEPGVVTTASGLQYKVIKPGEGDSPAATDTVTVHYTGTLIDGTVFDSSLKRNQPATFPVNAVIPGWTEAMQLMKPGARYKLVLPSELGYGESGAGNIIGPNAVLVFEVELISVEKAPPATTAPAADAAGSATTQPATK